MFYQYKNKVCYHIYKGVTLQIVPGQFPPNTPPNSFKFSVGKLSKGGCHGWSVELNCVGWILSGWEFSGGEPSEGSFFMENVWVGVVLSLN